jgi:type II secretory pathway pseudopilin PulG
LDEGYKGSPAIACARLPRFTLRCLPGSNTRGASYAPSGFTLVEVVVAAAVLITLIIGLSGVFARGVNGFKQAQLLTMAQNLAEFQTEDIKNLAPSVLSQLVSHTYSDINYPYSSSADVACGTLLYDGGSVVEFDDRYCWAYDSGKLQTDFMVDGVTQVGAGFVAGGTTVPAIPTNDDLLLGSNIVIDIYGVDPLIADRVYWRDDLGWYYWSGELKVRHGTPHVGTLFYYRVILQHEAYPLFSRQVRVARYDAATPGGSDVWSASLDEQYRTYQGDTRTKFEYDVTVWYSQNGVDRVLFRSGGTIAQPFARPIASLRGGRIGA